MKERTTVMTNATHRTVGRAAIVLSAALLVLQPARAQQGDHWVGTWMVAHIGRPQNPPAPVAPPAPALPAAQGQTAAPAPAPTTFMHFNNQTLRQIVRTSNGGTRARVVLSNAFGTTPLTVGAAHIALRDKDSAIVPSSGRALTFSGKKTMAIPSGAVLISDPVDLAVPTMGDLAIDLYLPGNTDTSSPLTTFTSALQTSYVSETGNFAGASPFPVVARTPSWFVVSRIEVMAPQSVGTVVAVGDSITAGARSTADTNNRYPNHLARRLAAQSTPMAVLNAGIGGNRVLTEGAYTAGVNVLGRFERDVLAQPGITHAIVLEGINDIGNARDNPSPTAEDLIAAHKQLIERAHTRGIVMIGATLTPFEGAFYFTPVGEAKRLALNQWIRTSRAYDGVVDFDEATRDPSHPARFLPQYDSGDHLHPGDAGYKAMGDAIDLALFKKPAAVTRSSGR
jgi:lysophospholipase L1-like esterase